MSKKTSIVWFRNDLRLSDNLALTAALAQNHQILPVFVWSPEEEREWEVSKTGECWLLRSLGELDKSLRLRGSRLLILRGPAAKCIQQLSEQTQADSVFCSRRFESAAISQELDVRMALLEIGVNLEAVDNSTLISPKTLLTAANTPYKVFTAFWNSFQKLDDPGLRLSAPENIPSPEKWPDSVPVSSLITTSGSSFTLHTEWKPGELGAFERLEKFKQSVFDYNHAKDLPAIAGTSKLSAHLRWGEISPRRIWFELRSLEMNTAKASQSVTPFLRQLVWREFAIYTLFHFPSSPMQPLDARFLHFPWSENNSHLEAWKKGMTGYPIVDAGMRQLAETGWMHNRVRMIVGSFLVKDLMIPWLEGAKWFWETLVDADLANNTMGWQWIAGCGSDAAPFFRVFNPTLQSIKFDPDGTYLRTWLPELRDLSNTSIHQPWKWSSEIPTGYPAPIVDHAQARIEALEAYNYVKIRASLET